MIKEVIKKNLLLNILYRLFNEFKTYIKIINGNFTYNTGQRNSEGEIEKSIAYVEKLINWYNQVVPLEDNFLNDKKVLEIGPGDSFSIAMRFLQLGAKEVTCIDKFYCNRDISFEKKLYLEIEKKYDTSILENGIIPTSKLKYEFGKGIENSNKDNYYDFICSMAVLEHIYEIDKAIDSMDRMLKINGTMAHRIDLRDHGMFSEYNHPLTFLTINEFIYKSFSYHSNNPNRKLIDYYKEKFKDLGNYEYKILITRVKDRNLDIFKENIKFNIDYNKSDIDFLEEIIGDFIDKFKKLSEEELLITGIFLVAKKIK
ncbi:methyltransferase domain-containing protein [Sulfurimonas sp.]